MTSSNPLATALRTHLCGELREALLEQTQHDIVAQQRAGRQHHLATLRAGRPGPGRMARPIGTTLTAWPSLRALALMGVGVLVLAAVMIATPVLAAGQKGPKLDTNGDGKVTQGEFQAGRSAQMLTLDSNKDGKLSRAEFAALGEQFGTPPTVRALSANLLGLRGGHIPFVGATVDGCLVGGGQHEAGLRECVFG